MRSISVNMPVGWGQSRIFLFGERAPRDVNTTCSVDHRGSRIIWSTDGAQTAACDLEHCERECNELAHIFGASSSNELLRRWVISESLAKIANVPILLWIRSKGLASVSSMSPQEETIFTSDGEKVVEVLTLSLESYVMAFARVKAERP